jgi:hypothetical protein
MTETEQLRNRVSELEALLGIEGDDVETFIRWAVRKAVEIQTDSMRDRVTELKAIVGAGNDDVSKLLAVLDATPQQCEIIGFMLKRSVATRDALLTVLYGDRPECDRPEPKLIDVQMVKVKRALSKVGITVKTEWGYGGWALSRADKDRLKALMAGEMVAA